MFMGQPILDFPLGCGRKPRPRDLLLCVSRPLEIVVIDTKTRDFLEMPRSTNTNLSVSLRIIPPEVSFYYELCYAFY